MPAQRLPWIKFWPEALDHEKFAELTDAEAWTWVVIWAKASLQPKRWRFASVEHARHVTGRPVRLIRRLVDIGLLDESETGLVIHNAKKWQELSNITPTQRESTVNGGGTPREHSLNSGGTVIYAAANSDLEGEGEGEGEGEEEGEGEPETAAAAGEREATIAELKALGLRRNHAAS